MERICKNCKHYWKDQPVTQGSNADICDINWSKVKINDSCEYFDPIQEDNKEQK